MDLSDKTENPFPGGGWQFAVARGGCGEFEMVTRHCWATWSMSERRRGRTAILGQFPFMSLPTIQWIYQFSLAK